MGNRVASWRWVACASFIRREELKHLQDECTVFFERKFTRKWILLEKATQEDRFQQKGSS